MSMKSRKKNEKNSKTNRIIRLLSNKTFNKVLTNLCIVVVIVLLLIFVGMNPIQVSSESAGAISDGARSGTGYIPKRF